MKRIAVTAVVLSKNLDESINAIFSPVGCTADVSCMGSQLPWWGVGFTREHLKKFPGYLHYNAKVLKDRIFTKGLAQSHTVELGSGT